MDGTVKWVIEILGVAVIGTLGSLIGQWLGKRKNKKEEQLLEAQARAEKAKEEDTLSGAALRMYNSVRDDLSKLRTEFLAYQSESMRTIRDLTDKNYELERRQNALLEENKTWLEKYRRLELDNQEWKAKNTQLEAAILSLQDELTQYKKENGRESNSSTHLDPPAPGSSGGRGNRRKSKPGD